MATVRQAIARQAPPGALAVLARPVQGPACFPVPSRAGTRRRQPHRQARAPRCAAAATPPAAVDQADLERFLGWALAQGVEGVGGATAKTGLFEGEGGERGVVCLRPLAQGDTVLALGTRLAISDYRGDQEEQRGGDDERPWSVQLAGQLLDMLRQEACPWQPYLAVLPRVVPSPLTTFTWDEIQAIEYEPMRLELDRASWLAASACQQGTYTREQWDWALSVVHSRTFGASSGSRPGGVGVRMLVPLVDMLNHAGDFVVSPPGVAPPTVKACDNVRWDLRAPREPGGDWEMVVSATRDIAAGEELLLSYGERNNDDFLLHYGFVPPRNPHDDVALFPDIEAAIDWWLSSFLPVGALPPQALQVAIGDAYEAAEQEDVGGAAAESVLAAVPEAEADAIRAQLERIKLSAGGMVDARLLAAYRALFEAAAGAVGPDALGAGWQQQMRVAVGRRARELLAGMPTPLPRDLETLAGWERESGQQQHGWAAALTHYLPAIERYEQQHGAVAAPVEPDSAPSVSTEGAGSSEVPMLDAGAVAADDLALAQMLLGRGAADAEAASAAAAMSAGGDGEASAGEGNVLPLLYRCYKKQILWDAVLLSAE